MTTVLRVLKTMQSMERPAEMLDIARTAHISKTAAHRALHELKKYDLAEPCGFGPMRQHAGMRPLLWKLKLGASNGSHI